MPSHQNWFERRWLQRVSFVIGVVGTLWGCGVWLLGGGEITLAGHLLRTHDPFRPLFLGLLGISIFVLSSESRLHVWERTTQLGRTVHHACALAVTVGVFLFALIWASTAAGGSDSYGYVSQADLWLRGQPTIDQSWAKAAPWPLARESLAPLGYSPSPDPQVPWTIVPTYSPGLPLLMAAAKSIGGHAAMFWVVPILGALLILATYGIGCRLASPTAGLIGAWLVATSPVMLFMVSQPMTDVPIAAAWALVFYWMLGRTIPSALAAGLAVSVGVLIRPNMVFGVGIVGLWYLVRALRARKDARLHAIGCAATFALGAGLGIGAVALINNALYGSPLRSGYGTLEGMFAREHFWPNVRHYLSWLVDSQTPVVVAGFVALALPTSRLWPAAKERLAPLAASLFVLATWLFYCVYLPFDAWWFLRFLLPTWPFIFIGVGAMVVALSRRAAPRAQFVVAVLVLILGMYELSVASRRGAFENWRQERHFPSVATLVREQTGARSAIISMLHSGSVRYYGGRVTVRYDYLDPEWLDRTVAWLVAHDVRPYLLVEDWEMSDVRKRFAGQQALVTVARAPVARHEGPANVSLYDLAPAAGAAEPKTVVKKTDVRRATRPAPESVPRLDLRASPGRS